MLRHSLGLMEAADRVDAAIDQAIVAGARTADLALPGEKRLSTQQMTDAVLKFLA